MPTRRSGPRLLSVAVAMLGVVAVNWFWRGCGVNNTEYGLGSVKEASTLTGLRFPRGTTLLAGRVRRGWVPGLWAVLTMSPESANDFLQQPIRNRQGAGFGVESPAEIAFGWGSLPEQDPAATYNPRIARIKQFRYVYGGDPYHEGGVQILVDCDSATARTVYLSWLHD